MISAHDHSIKWSPAKSKERHKSTSLIAEHPPAWQLKNLSRTFWSLLNTINEYLAKNIFVKKKRKAFSKTKISMRKHSPLKTVFKNTIAVLAYSFSNMYSYNCYKTCHGARHASWGEMHFWQSWPHANMSYIL